MPRSPRTVSTVRRRSRSPNPLMPSTERSRPESVSRTVMRNGSALTAMAAPILPMVASRETMPGLVTGHSEIATMWWLSAWLKPRSRSFSVLPRREHGAAALAGLGCYQRRDIRLQSLRLQGVDHQVALEGLVEAVGRVLQRAAAAGAVLTVRAEVATVRFDPVRRCFAQRDQRALRLVDRKGRALARQREGRIDRTSLGFGNAVALRAETGDGQGLRCSWLFPGQQELDVAVAAGISARGSARGSASPCLRPASARVRRQPPARCRDPSAVRPC